MKYLFSAFFTTSLLILINCNSANALEKIPLSMHTSLNQQLAINNERYGVVGQSVLILKNHQKFYRGQHGVANIELNVDITEKHIFPSYSITKLLTSVLMMQQVEKGRVDLKNSIRAYLPYLSKKWQPVTIEHLLSHTSGIPRYFDIAMKKGNFLPTKKAVFLSLIDEPEHFEIGTKNSYNNTNFLLLSAILEAKTGKSYQALVAEVIINPLGLKNTGHTSAKDIINNHVTSYRGANGKIRKNMNIDWPEYTFSHSALYSTPEDLATFMTALVIGKFVSQKTLKQLWQPMKLADGNKGRYAFGFEYAFEDGYYHFGHDGGNHVKLRHYFNPKDSADNYTLVYATNGNAYDVWTDVLADSLMAIIDPDKFEMAAIKEQFLSNILEKNDKALIEVYKAVSNIFDGDEALIERFLLYRAYALRYGSGAESSIPAFEFLTTKFPNSANARESLADTWSEIGNKKKAIENYRLVLKVSPKSRRAKEQIEKLEGTVQK
jgi:CubicO group peptidase (beta-lactamase class C family)